MRSCHEETAPLTSHSARGCDDAARATPLAAAAQVDEVYSELSAEPVNAASLGQVYRGRLRATGEEVAVKVQRPSIADSIAMDMLLLRG